MARPKIKPNIDPTQLVTNPFSLQDDFIIRARGVKTSYETISKQELDNATFTQKAKVQASYLAEREEYSKVYTHCKKREYVMSMPPRAHSLFLFIMYELVVGQDWLWLNKDRYMGESEISLNTYKAALLDLVKYNVITPTIYVDTYWINPKFFFSGNRLKKYPDAVIEED